MYLHRILTCTLAILIAGCATHPNPKLVQAAQWKAEQERKETKAQAARDARWAAAHPEEAGRDPVAEGPDAADPLVDTPYGKYRLSVLKKVIRELKAE
jgi:hypothetical protein